ncbi:MAG: type II secretion system F family protein [Aminipila sp.]
MIYVIAIFLGIFIFCCMFIALQSYGEQHDAVQRRLQGINSTFQKSYIHDEELNLPFLERIMKLIIRPFISKIRKSVIKNSGHGVFFRNLKNDKLKKNVYHAGLAMEVHEYQMIRMAVMLGVALVGFAVSFFLKQSILRCLIAALVGIYIGYVVLRFHLANRMSKRRKAMEQQLPEVLDLLSVNVEAGLGFEQAIFHVTEHLEGPLIDELTITYREMSMGRSKREALLIFGERCDINEVKTFVGAIVQAGELGISIKNVLRAQAAAMRQNRRNKIEERAQKISIKILLPMVFFIFPVIFIILMGPAVVKVMEQFG